MSVKDAKFSDLIGKTLIAIQHQEEDGDKLVFTCDDGTVFMQLHYQDCCEQVSIESIVGDLEDLIGSPILIAEDSTNREENPPDIPGPKYQESFTWTFYKLATTKGYVDIRWYGESNGYYSEDVDFMQVLQ